MRARHIRTVVSMAIISIVGIMIMQVVWFKNAYDIKQRQFNHTVFLALQSVAEQILNYKKIQVPLSGMVNQVAPNYYIVNINSEIENSVLEFLLKNEFEKRNIAIDFEYGVYSCESQKMVYGNYVSMKDSIDKVKRSELPLWEKDKYYFSVLFPKQTLYFTSQMDIWIISSCILLAICSFFGYAVVIILKQKRFSEIQKDFINNMTHELKTPISTIFVSLKLIKKPEINQNPTMVLKYAGIIDNETCRLKGQVDKVLQIALLDKEKVNFQFQKIDLHQHIHKVIKNADLAVSEKNGAINLRLEASNPIILGDTIHIINVFYNLIDNAAKYCRRQPLITISTRNIKKNIEVIIKDNGIGISKVNCKKVFDKFYRVPTGNVHDVKGFGLGLYYVKTAVEAHKGTIKIFSEIEKGSAIRITFPVI